MKSPVVVPIIVLLAGVLLLIPVAIIGAGIGISGPEQVFEIGQGGHITSYLWVWNEGSSSQNFETSVSQGIDNMVTINPTSFTLYPGGSRKISINYDIPIDLVPGTYNGRINIGTNQELSASASRIVTIRVVTSQTATIYLRKGLNLVGWLGSNCDFEEGLGKSNGPTKVWRRNPDGEYSSANLYDTADLWWSSDESFTGLKFGDAYFVECDFDCYLDISPGSNGASIHLEKGTNLIAWTSDTKTFSEAFPQNPDNYPVTKVWRRTDSGSYDSVQYYPQADVWWGTNPAFTEMVKGEAYFVETTEAIDIPA